MRPPSDFGYCASFIRQSVLVGLAPLFDLGRYPPRADAMTDRKAKQMLRAELYGDQHGCCYYCEEPMTLLSRYPMGTSLASNVCTLGRAPEGHHVAVCNGCNVGKNERDKMRRRAG